MKQLLAIFCLFCTIGFALKNHTSSNTDFHNTINPIIGDISFVEKFGVVPDDHVNDDLRIETHLSYVEQQLRQKDTNHLPPHLQSQREETLDLLHDYWTAGIFPKNYDYANERKPCFIDKDKRICAVGYLVEQTMDRSEAEHINSLFQYAAIEEMKSPILTDWASESGLSLEEIAMIQPTYGPVPSENYVNPSYAVPSALLSGTNLSLATLNAIQLNNPGDSKLIPKLGILLGAGQLTLGMVNYYKEEKKSPNNYLINEGRKNLSLLNMGLGTTSLLLSTYNLIKNRTKKRDHIIGWDVYGYPTADNQVEVGFRLTKGL